MGTTFEALVAGCEMSYARQAVQAVFAEVERLEGLFSRFNASSEVSQINRLKPGESMRIGVETFECLTAAEKIRLETGGAFDINFRSLLKSRRQTEEEAPRMIFSSSNGFNLALEPAPIEQGEAWFDLDLGGIGKGYALDRAVETLIHWDIDRVLLHSGTSTVLAVGDAPDLKPDEEGWPVGAGAARGFAGPNMRLFLKNRALSGSGKEVKGAHIVDPRTGHPADRYLAAWVSHPRAAAADALSTAFMVMSLEEIGRYCNGHREVWALVITNARACCVFNKEILV